MYMEEKRCVRAIKVSSENRAKLARMFGCTERMVYKALCYESDSELARKLRHVARKELGGWIEAMVPEDEIFYDTVEGNERVLRQYFPNGAVLEISKDTGQCRIMHRGELAWDAGRISVTEIVNVQMWARGL